MHCSRGTPADRELAARLPEARLDLQPEFVDRQRLQELLDRAHLVAGVFGTSAKAGRVVPFKVVHALASGRPVITADTPAVRRYFALSRTPFPDQGNEIIAIAHSGDTVLVEFWLTGTHTGALRLGDRVIAPTGKAFRVRMAASFEFAPNSDKIICERPYFDTNAVPRSLGLI